MKRTLFLILLLCMQIVVYCQENDADCLTIKDMDKRAVQFPCKQKLFLLIIEKGNFDVSGRYNYEVNVIYQDQNGANLLHSFLIKNEMFEESNIVLTLRSEHVKRINAIIDSIQNKKDNIEIYSYVAGDWHQLSLEFFSEKDSVLQLGKNIHHPSVLFELTDKRQYESLISKSGGIPLEERTFLYYTKRKKAHEQEYAPFIIYKIENTTPRGTKEYEINILYHDAATQKKKIKVFSIGEYAIQDTSFYLNSNQLELIRKKTDMVIQKNKKKSVDVSTNHKITMEIYSPKLKRYILEYKMHAPSLLRELREDKGKNE